MTAFSKLWDTEVKPLAQACVAEPELVRLMEKEKPSTEEKEYFEITSPKYKDIFGMYYISNMISKVDHALADGRQSAAEFAVCGVYEVLNRSSYFQNVFDGDETNEEWKTRAALRDGLHKLMSA
jgi:hypothetical protein